jgi:hypothetical protein
MPTTESLLLKDLSAWDLHNTNGFDAVHRHCQESLQFAIQCNLKCNENSTQTDGQTDIKDNEINIARQGQNT